MPSPYFIYDDINTEDFGVIVLGTDGFDSTVREYTTETVNCRNGDVLVDSYRYKNVDVTYHCFIGDNFKDSFDEFRSKLMSKSGYYKLKDSFHKDVYRMAYIAENITVKKTTPMWHNGSFDVVFNCKPQQYLVNEEEFSTTITDTIVSMQNPTNHLSKPLIKLELSVPFASTDLPIIKFASTDRTKPQHNNHTWTIRVLDSEIKNYIGEEYIQNDGYIDVVYIDCETMQIYAHERGTAEVRYLNASQLVELSEYCYITDETDKSSGYIRDENRLAPSFPQIFGKDLAVWYITNTPITKATVYPRWFRL